MAKKKASKKPPTKSEILNALAEATGLTRKQVASVLDALADLMGKHIGKGGAGQFALPGLFKVQVIHKPATKETTKPNPFRPGEMMVVKAKPARNVVKIRPLKKLKEMAE